MLSIHPGCRKLWIDYFMIAKVHTSSCSFSISLSVNAEATSEYWYTLLPCELETMCVMAQYNGERILYNQCGTKYITGIILRAWASLTTSGEILFVSVVSVASLVDVLF